MPCENPDCWCVAEFTRKEGVVSINHPLKLINEGTVLTARLPRRSPNDSHFHDPHIWNVGNNNIPKLRRLSKKLRKSDSSEPVVFHGIAPDTVFAEGKWEDLIKTKCCFTAHPKPPIPIYIYISRVGVCSSSYMNTEQIKIPIEMITLL
jgi:hypothetical protein